MIQILIFGIDIYTEKNFLLDKKNAFLKLQLHNVIWKLQLITQQFRVPVFPVNSRIQGKYI